MAKSGSSLIPKPHPLGYITLGLLSVGSVHTAAVASSDTESSCRGVERYNPLANSGAATIHWCRDYKHPRDGVSAP